MKFFNSRRAIPFAEYMSKKEAINLLKALKKTYDKEHYRIERQIISDILGGIDGQVKANGAMLKHTVTLAITKEQAIVVIKALAEGSVIYNQEDFDFVKERNPEAAAILVKSCMGEVPGLAKAKL